MPFDSPDIKLEDLLKSVGTGRIRLPNFQRDWKWDTDRIASLLASVCLGYPVGVVMLLETGGPDVEFDTRLVAGVEGAGATQVAEQLILDGQQRLTSLYQSLRASKVHTQDSRKKRIDRRYYLDMAVVLDPYADREDAIVAVPEDGIVWEDFGRKEKLNLSSRQREWDTEHFPLSIAFDAGAVFQWVNGYAAMAEGRMARWIEFHEAALKNVVDYTVPVIVLKRDTPRAAVCTVFEKVNTGGVVLDVFELLTAMFAATHFDLRTAWDGSYARLARHKVLRELRSTDFLQAVTLLATQERRQAWNAGDSDKPPAVSCRRSEILRLTRDQYERWAPEVERGFDWAARFVNGERIFEARDVPYASQLVPLAAIHVALGDKAETIGNVARLRRWFWCGVLGELYGGATETRFANDLEQVVSWIGGSAEEPITVYESSFDPGRLLTLRTRTSAAYKGIYALLMAKGCKDWHFDQDITLANHHELAVDIHHVFPKTWCNANGVDELRRESIVNKTPLSATTNRHVIRAKAPSAYVRTLAEESQTAPDVIASRIAGHQIDYGRLVADDFDGYFASRRRALHELIGTAMGKEITDVDVSVPAIEKEYDLDDVEPGDSDIAEEVA